MNIDAYKEKYQHDRFYDEIWNKGEYDMVKDLPKDVVIDIGACAGEFSFWMQSLGAEKIYAFEPHPDTFKELEDNIFSFGFNKVEAYSIAISDVNENIKLYDGGRGGHFIQTHPSAKSWDVASITLPKFIDLEDIDRVNILKTDAESAESVIFNSPDFADVADRIDVIVGEHLSDCVKRLESFGFTMTRYHPNFLFERKTK